MVLTAFKLNIPEFDDLGIERQDPVNFVKSEDSAPNQGNVLECTFIGKSRIDGFPMFKIEKNRDNLHLGEIWDGYPVWTITPYETLELTDGYYPTVISTLEDSISGIVSHNDYLCDNIVKDLSDLEPYGPDLEALADL